MHIHELRGDNERYRELALVDQADWPVIYRFVGVPLLERWQPLRVRDDRDEAEPQRPVGDFAYLAGVPPVVSAAARETVRALLRDHVEYLPCVRGEERLFIINPLHVVDGIDEA